MDFILVLTPPKQRRKDGDSKESTDRNEEQEEEKRSCLIHFDLYGKETKIHSFTNKSWDKVNLAK